MDDGRLLSLFTVLALGAAASMGRGSRIRRSGPPVERPDPDPVEGRFFRHAVEPSTIVIGPSRWGEAIPKRKILLTEGEINAAVGEAMVQLREGHLRDPGTSMQVARMNPRSDKPREVAFVVARWNENRDGYRVVVFRGHTFSMARLDPAHDWFFPYSNSALNDTTGTVERARVWLIDRFEEAWAKRDGPRSTGSLIRRRGPPVEAPGAPVSLLRAVREANQVGGPRVKAGSARSILAWLRWNDRNSDYPDELAENLDDARRALVSVFLEDHGTGSAIRRMGPPVEVPDPPPWKVFGSGIHRRWRRRTSDGIYVIYRLPPAPRDPGLGRPTRQHAEFELQHSLVGAITSTVLGTFASRPLAIAAADAHEEGRR